MLQKSLAETDPEIVSIMVRRLLHSFSTKADCSLIRNKRFSDSENPLS